jgi:Family of unknown function (DUF6527)
MKKNYSIEHKFVEFIPRRLNERTLYISIQFATATHKCFCACGAEVVTPISPAGWHLTFDGETVSLSPSVGSWSLKCKSHYWIRCNSVVWAPAMPPEEIAEVRKRDDADWLRHYGPQPTVAARPLLTEQEANPVDRKGFWAWLKSLIR